MVITDYLIHVANILYVGSYSVRDILWLRILTVVAMVALLPYYYTRQEPLLEAIAWNILFMAINGYQLYKLLLERRPVRLTVEQQRLYELAFSSLTPRDFMKLSCLGSWEELEPGARLVDHGEKLDKLTVIFDGDFEVELADGRTASLQGGQFVGEVAYVTGKPACATVRAENHARIVQWKHEELRTFLTAHPDIQAAMQNVIGTDLAGKLRSEQGRDIAPPRARPGLDHVGVRCCDAHGRLDDGAHRGVLAEDLVLMGVAEAALGVDDEDAPLLSVVAFETGLAETADEAGTHPTHEPAGAEDGHGRAVHPGRGVSGQRRVGHDGHLREIDVIALDEAFDEVRRAVAHVHDLHSKPRELVQPGSQKRDVLGTRRAREVAQEHDYGPPSPR